MVARVTGYNGVTSRITVKVTLEKKMLLGLWWSDVDEWTASSTNASDTFEFTKDVGSGTYRCTFEVTVLSANKKGLISLAKQMLYLANNDFHCSGAHIHFDSFFTKMDNAKYDLIIEKTE